MATAEKPNTTRQLLAAATRPAKARASRMPSSRPPVTRPTSCPRRSAGTTRAAIGSTIWATTAVEPSTSAAVRNTTNEGASAHAAAAATATASTRSVSFRSSTTSPSGTSATIPAA